MRLNAARRAKVEFAADVARVQAADPGSSPAVGVAVRPGGNLGLAVRAREISEPLAELVAGWADRLGEEIDVRATGPIRKFQRVRPLVPGASISLEGGGTGTIGSFVHLSDAPAGVGLLSNNHVLADENRAEVGASVIQPGVADGGSPPADTVAELAAFVPIDPAGVNFVDAAVATIVDGVEWSMEPFERYGGLVGISDLGDDELIDFPMVAKFGRTTDHTVGTVTAIELDLVRVQYDIGVVRFDDQIEVEGLDGAFSAPGDSGSLVVTADESGAEAVGLLFAGSEIGGSQGQGLTYLNPIVTVLAQLSSELVLDGGNG
jgi:hypothetical protein